MHLYGSREAVSAMRAVAQTLPASLTDGSADAAEVGAVDEAAFGDAIVVFHDQTCLDVSYAPEDCDVD